MTAILTRRVLFAGASGLILAGCADVVGPPAAPKLYTLNPPLSGPLAGPKVGWALSIQTPDASAGLDSERIAITRPPSGLDYYADAAWADHLPALVGSALLEAFERSGRIGAVARDSDAARADYVLSTDLRDFSCRYDAGEGAPLAVVRLGARVVDAKSRKIAGSAVFAKEVRASANSVPAGVAALSEAYGGVLAELVPWVLDRGMPAA
jgi:cholesterol transport system auxiliary component